MKNEELRRADVEQVEYEEAVMIIYSTGLRGRHGVPDAPQVRQAGRLTRGGILLLLVWIVGASGVQAQEADRPVIVQAESGQQGAEIDLLEEEGLTFVRARSDWWDVEGAPDWNRPVSGEHVLTYEVTFPVPGEYDLFVRVRVSPQDQQGRNAANNDSFFFPEDFGVKNPSDAQDWSFVNQIDGAAGFTEPADVVRGHGSAGSNVWKWLNVSRNTYHNPGITYDVPAGSLTQTLQIAGRESYLDIDRLAFGRSQLYFTVENLENGDAGSAEPPADPGPSPQEEPLAAGHEKFLGNLYTGSGFGDDQFDRFWNQVTPENAGKWGVAEGTRGSINWAGLDAAYALAKENGFPFRFHVLVWGNQQPSWMTDLAESPDEQLGAIENWFRAVAGRFPGLDFVEVVNEPLHDPPDCSHPNNQGANCSASGDYVEALGGAGETGWDWVLNAFRLAREIFSPETKLLINDYGILSSSTNVDRYLEVIRLLQEEDLIDGIGVQGHAFSTRGSAAAMTARLDALAETGLPVQVTEMDVDGNPETDPNLTSEQSDQNQLADIQRIFPALWEHPAVEGITMWGWKPGMWRTPQEAYLLRADGSERPAMAWLREYLEEQLVRADAPHDVPAEFSLFANYPNPFNPSTQISYRLSETTFVHLQVYDVLGRHVSTLVDERQPPGHHTVTFEAGSLPSSVYLYRLQAGSAAATRAMTVVR